MKKKKWKKPKLIRLVRNKPEEAVLLGCKNDGPGASGNVVSDCYSDPCVECSFPAGS